jgi:hypothetical protein
MKNYVAPVLAPALTPIFGPYNEKKKFKFDITFRFFPT